MRCKKCAYEIGLASICPMCGVDQEHIKKEKKKPWQKKAFFIIQTSGKVHKKIVRNCILAYVMLLFGFYAHFEITNSNKMSIIPVGILSCAYLTYHTIRGYIQPGLDKTSEFKIKARLSTGIIIFYGVFVLVKEYLKLFI